MAIVIIVDDDLGTYHLIDKAVQELSGHITFHACTSRCFFKLIKKAVPDFIFLKAVMPGPDGMYCLKKLRANRRYHDVPVITYAATHEYEKQAYKYRANLYIPKPNSQE